MLAVRRDWSVRVIPLPREVDMAGEVEVARGDLAHVFRGSGSPVDALIESILASVAPAPAPGRWTVRARLLQDEADSLPPGLARRLASLPNPGQAYAIVSRASGDGGETLLAGSTPLSLLYAARTFRQLLTEPVGSTAGVTVVPVGTIVDWPEISRRGMWGGNTEDALASMAELKLDSWAVHAWPGTDERGAPRIKLDAATVARAAHQGIEAVPIFIHLEQLATQGMKGWEDCFNVPDPERAQRSDYVPGLCLSRPRTRELIARLLGLIARLPGVGAVDFCLSEEWTPCLCPDCRGKEPFLLEVDAVLDAYRQVRVEHPGFHLRVETSQGSHEVNDRIAALLPPEVGVQYYDGGRTYSSAHAPIIPDALAAYARAGGWLGVCAQITSSWRSTLPWTGPQFVKARMEELAAKRLSYFIGYAVPANHFHELNVTAAAEWAWNPAGRDPRDLARAYAWRRGLSDPGLFADWAVAIGPVGWDIAATRLFLTLVYDPTFGLDKGVPFDHRFEGGPEVLSEDRIREDLERAAEALGIARRLRLAEAIEETELDVACLHAIRALSGLSRLHLGVEAGSAANGSREAAELLDLLDRAAAVASTRLRSWGARICSLRGTPMPNRLNDTIQALPRAANVARERIGTALGVQDPHPEHRAHEIGRWSADDFTAASAGRLVCDATPFLTAPGDYAVGFEFLPGKHGLGVSGVRIVETARDGSTEGFESTDLMERVSMWVRAPEVTIPVPRARASSRFRVEIEAGGPPPDSPAGERSCNGRVTLRRHWPPETPAF